MKKRININNYLSFLLKMIFNTLYPSETRKLEDIIYKEAEEKAARIRKIVAESKLKDIEKERKDDIVLSFPDPKEAASEGKEKKFRIIQPKQAYYYHPKKSRSSFGYYEHSYSAGIIINKVPQSVLGHNVLGRAFISLNYIEILESLQGLDLEEVKKHEINHIFYPHLSEQEIRDRTRYELPFAAKYN
jgi:hypothetical protein